MASVMVNSFPREFSILTKNFNRVSSSGRARSLVFSNGRITLHFNGRQRRSLCMVGLHGGLTKLRPGLKKCVSRWNELNELRGRGNVRGICFCKRDNGPEDIDMEEGIKKVDWRILERWDVPWDWKATLFTIMASGLSFLLTGLVETAAVSYLGIFPGHLTSVDGQATLIFIDQFLITAVGLTVIYAFVNRYQPLPDDFFRFEWKEPLNIKNGWLLWGGIGTIVAAFGVGLTGVALSALNGEPPPREVSNSCGCDYKCKHFRLCTSYAWRISSTFCVGGSVRIRICSNSKSSYFHNYTRIVELRSDYIVDIPKTTRL